MDGIDVATAHEYVDAGALGIGVNVNLAAAARRGIATPLLRDAPAGGDLAALARRIAGYRRTLESS
ncbi:hypothetical protein ACXJJ3_41535 [Kribbella sp. WER1]